MLEKWCRGFVYSNFWVGLSVASLSLVSFIHYEHWNWNYLLLCFFSTVSFYGYARLVESKNMPTDPEQHIAAWTLAHIPRIFLISVLATLTSIFLLFSLPSTPRLLFIGASALSGFYTVPSLFNQRGVRYMAGFKLIYIAAIWTFVTLTIPAVMSNASLSTFTILQHLERFLFLVAITIPFDIRDANSDSTDLLTLPMWIGIHKAKQVALLCMALVIGLQFLPAFQTISWFEIAVYTLSGVLIWNSSENRSDMYFSLFIEGLPILLAITTLLWFGASSISI